MNPNDATAPQLTARAIILAIILAMLLAAANTYLGLFAGMTIASAIPAAVVSMAVLRALGGGGILENNIVQTGASAGSSIASGVIFTVPALVIMATGPTSSTCGCSPSPVSAASLGVLFSVPLRRSLIVDQQMAFPEGKAAAEVLRAGENPAQGVKVLGVSALAGGFVKLSAASGLRLIPDSARDGGILWQVPRLFRHEHVAGTARRGLHRRAEHRHRGARRQRHLLEHRDPDLSRARRWMRIRSLPPSSPPSARVSRRTNAPRPPPDLLWNTQIRYLGVGRHAGWRPVGAGEPAQVDRLGCEEWSRGDARRRRRRSSITPSATCR